MLFKLIISIVFTILFILLTLRLNVICNDSFHDEKINENTNLLVDIKDKQYYLDQFDNNTKGTAQNNQLKELKIYHNNTIKYEQKISFFALKKRKREIFSLVRNVWPGLKDFFNINQNEPINIDNVTYIMLDNDIIKEINPKRLNVSIENCMQFFLFDIPKWIRLNSEEKQKKYYELFFNDFKYNQLINDLNKDIKVKYYNTFILKNYKEMCLANEYCIELLRILNLNDKELLELLDSYEEKNIYYDYFNFNDYNKDNIIDILLTDNENYVYSENDYDSHIIVNFEYHLQSFYNLVEKKCLKFKDDSLYIFPVFDPEKEILDYYIRSLVINARSNYSIVKYSENFNYYSHLKIPAIFYLIPPIKKCKYHFCLVFVPYIIEYKQNGGFSIDYIIYNGKKINFLPSVNFNGDIEKGISSYNNNILKSVFLDIKDTKLFTNKFKTSSFLQEFVLLNGANNGTLMQIKLKDNFKSIKKELFINYNQLDHDDCYLASKSFNFDLENLIEDENKHDRYRNYFLLT